jgi:hypothetical protein
MSHPQTLQIPFPEFMLSIPTIQDSSQKLYTQSENSHFSCKFHKKVVPIPKKIDSFPKTIDYFPKNFYSIPKKIYSLLRILYSSFISFHTQ